MVFADVREPEQKVLVFPKIYNEGLVPDSAVLSIGQQRRAIVILDDTHYTCLRSEELPRRPRDPRRRRLMDVVDEKGGQLVISQKENEPFLIYPKHGIMELGKERLIIGKAQNGPGYSDGMPIRLLFRSNCEYEVWAGGLLMDDYSKHDHNVTYDEFRHLTGLVDKIFESQGIGGGLNQVREMVNPPVYRPPRR